MRPFLSQLGDRRSSGGPSRHVDAAAKFVAELRATKTDDHVLLLRTNMGAGHGGASGRYDALHEWAIRYAFILVQILPQNTRTTIP